MMKRLGFALVMIGSSTVCLAQGLSGLCMISESQRVDRPSTSQLMMAETGCSKGPDEGCTNTNNSTVEWSRWTGVSLAQLQGAGAALTAKMTGEAGELECSGIVHDGVLSGRYRFSPNASFPQKMAAMGFDGITERKQLSFLMLDISTAWVKEMQGLGVTELSTNKLTGLRALHVDANYIHAMAAAGYPELRANKLTEMKAVGVTPERAQEARSLGFQPTEQELVQMSIFKIDRPFVERMRAKGLGDLTVAKLIKIKIFKLDD
jgi:hypothetical protein